MSGPDFKRMNTQSHCTKHVLATVHAKMCGAGAKTGKKTPIAAEEAEEVQARFAKTETLYRKTGCGLHAGGMVCEFGKGQWQYLGRCLIGMLLATKIRIEDGGLYF